jgi:hypothetical protein
LGCDLSAIEDEGACTQDVADGGGVSAERGALACGMPDLCSSGMIKQIAGVEEFISRTRPRSAKIQRRLLRVMLEEAERRDTTCVPVGCCLLTARSNHGYQKSSSKCNYASSFCPWHPFCVQMRG